MEGKSLTEYGASYHAWDEKEKVVMGLLTAMDSMWAQSDCQCHGNAGSVEFLMDMFDVMRDGTFLYQARAVAKYIYTKRFYDSKGNVQFADETKQSTRYDYGTGAAGAMRAILRADGYVYGRLYMLGDLGKRKL